MSSLPTEMQRPLLKTFWRRFWVAGQTTTPPAPVTGLIAKRNAHTNHVYDDGRCYVWQNKGRWKTERQWVLLRHK